MKAIVTKYHGPTNTRGARITADDGDGNRVSIPYPHELSGSDVHYKAAKTLCRKMGWECNLIGGGLKNGYAWVFTDADHDAYPLVNAALRYRNQIIGRMQAEGATDTSDSEIVRTLGPCVCGPMLVKYAQALRAVGELDLSAE